MGNLTHDQVTKAEFIRSFWLLSSASYCRPKARARFVSGSWSVINAHSPPTASKGSRTPLPVPRPPAVSSHTLPHRASSDQDSTPSAPLETAGQGPPPPAFPRSTSKPGSGIGSEGPAFGVRFRDFQFPSPGHNPRPPCWPHSRARSPGPAMSSPDLRILGSREAVQCRIRKVALAAHAQRKAQDIQSQNAAR